MVTPLRRATRSPATRPRHGSPHPARPAQRLKDTLAQYGVEHVGLELERFGARIREEIGLYGRIVRAAGIKVE